MGDLIYRLDLWVIGLYLLGMMGIAARVSSGSRDVEGYSVGSRSMSGWLLGLSVMGTFTSSITFLGLPAKTYGGDWNAFIFGLTIPFAALIAVAWFVPLYRRQVRLSAFELLEARFGYWARLYADASYVVLQLIRTATVLLLVALAVQPIMGWEIVPTLIVLGLIVIVYDVVGGFRAVVWTDAVQVLVLIVGAAWALWIVADAWPGGPIDLLRSVPTPKFSLGQWTNWDAAEGRWDWSQSTILVLFLYGLTENLRNYGTDQNYIQRMLAARDDRAARRSIWVAAVGYPPVSAMVCLIGTALFMHYQHSSGSLPADTPADGVFPYFIAHELPPVVRGLVISAVLAAAMSTIDSSLNSVSTVLLVDVVRRFRRGPPRVPEILTLRLTTALCGLLGTGAAVLMYELFDSSELRTIMDIWWQYAGTAGGGLFGLFLLAWLAPRLPGWAAALAVAVSIPVLAWGTFARDLPQDSPWKSFECPLHPNLVGICGTLTLLAIGGLVMLGVWRNWLTPNPRVANEK